MSQVPKMHSTLHSPHMSFNITSLPDRLDWVQTADYQETSELGWQDLGFVPVNMFL